MVRQPGNRLKEIRIYIYIYIYFCIMWLIIFRMTLETILRIMLWK